MSQVSKEGSHDSRPVTAGSRIPSILGRARLSRAQHHSDEEDDHDTVVSDNVLITELGAEGGHPDALPQRRKKAKPVVGPVLDDGAEYDTDLELDGLSLSFCPHDVSF